MTYIFNVTNAHIRNVKTLIEKANFDYSGTVATSEEGFKLEIQVHLNTPPSIFRLDIHKENSGVVATAMSHCCLPLDAVFISGKNDVQKALLKTLLGELETLSARFLRQLELPITLSQPSETPLFIPDPQPGSSDEQDLYSTVAYLNNELDKQPPIKNTGKANPRARNRLLKNLSFRNSSIFHIARQRSVSLAKLSTTLLEGIAVLSLQNTEGSDFHRLNQDEISEKGSLRWSKLRYRGRNDKDTAIYCHIEMNNLCLNIFFAEVSGKSNANFEIKKCILKTLKCDAPREKPNAAGRVIPENPGNVYNRVSSLFQATKIQPLSVREYFTTCTELLYYVGKINETSVPRYKTSDASYVDVFPALQKYLLSVLLKNNPDSVWVYRFNNMVKIQKTCPSFWGIVPFLNSQI
jgi:hypothetical protein